MKKEVASLKTGIRSLNVDTQNTNNGAPQIEQREAFNTQLGRIDQAYSNTKQEAIDGKKALGVDGTTELGKFEDFYGAGGLREALVVQFEQAILNPTPGKINLDSEQLIEAVG